MTASRSRKPPTPKGALKIKRDNNKKINMYWSRKNLAITFSCIFFSAGLFYKEIFNFISQDHRFIYGIVSFIIVFQFCYIINLLVKK